MTSLAPISRQSWNAFASSGRSAFLPLSVSLNSFTSCQLPPLRKSSTAVRCASMPRPLLPWRIVETRRYETNLPSAILPSAIHATVVDKYVTRREGDCQRKDCRNSQGFGDCCCQARSEAESQLRFGVASRARCVLYY